jgi:putative transposase
MPRKSHSPEKILYKVRQVEVAVAKGSSVAHAIRGINVSENTYYRWHQEYGGLNIDQARRLKQLEQENARLKRTVAELALDKQILKEAAEALPVVASALNACSRYCLESLNAELVEC